MNKKQNSRNVNFTPNPKRSSFRAVVSHTSSMRIVGRLYRKSVVYSERNDDGYIETSNDESERGGRIQIQ